MKLQLPTHNVTIMYHMDTENFTVHCNVCGSLGTYPTAGRAENRKDTHDRGQDTGSEHGR
jgi:ribosomal protein S27E